MRHFYASLASKYPQAFNGIYLKLGEHDFATLKDAWTNQIDKLKPQKILVCEPGEYRIEQDLIALSKQKNVPLVIRDDTHFMCSKADFRHWSAGKKELRMEFFYRKMRAKFDVLMQGDTPIGDAWNYDAENRKAFARAGPQHVPTAPQVNIDALTKVVIGDVEKYFPHHPGSLKHFIWPVTRETALQFLHDFVSNKLAGIGLATHA